MVFNNKKTWDIKINYYVMTAAMIVLTIDILNVGWGSKMAWRWKSWMNFQRFIYWISIMLCYSALNSRTVLVSQDPSGCPFLLIITKWFDSFRLLWCQPQIDSENAIKITWNVHTIYKAFVNIFLWPLLKFSSDNPAV